jgi:predicted Ser/Thr protein kinase
MTRGQWERVRDLFERALECDPAPGPSWVEGAASDDPEVRAEVAALLAHHSQLGLFMAQPIGERLPDLMSEPDGPSPGQAIGPYTIVRELGRGGMGRVFLARDERLERTLALKMLPREWSADPARRERLRREARAAAALTHPGICTVYALEELDGELFIATEYVDGQTLREEIGNGPRPTATQALATAVELADALAAAHREGIAHRDLKPENVMRTRGGRIKILDFGLARAADPIAGALSLRVTEPLAVVGTPGYMAPEHLHGEAPNPRSDVFALGVLIHEYVTGEHPFAAPTSLGVMARVLEAPAPRLEKVAPAVSPVLASVVARCLAKAADDRFASAAEVRAALAEVTEAPRPSTTPQWWRTHQGVAIALYGLASAVAWQAKEWDTGSTARAAFIGVGLVAAAGGILRGHLLFTASVHPGALAAERRRTRPWTLGVDLILAALLGADGVVLAASRPLAAVLTLALGVGIVMARTVIEPSTTAASFDGKDTQQD